MKFMKLGKPENPTIVLLHGSGLSWWSMEHAARLFMKRSDLVAVLAHGEGAKSARRLGSGQRGQRILRHVKIHEPGYIHVRHTIAVSETERFIANVIAHSAQTPSGHGVLASVN